MIAQWLQQLFGGIVQAALNLVAALFSGIFGAPRATGVVSVRPATAPEVGGVHEVVLGSAPADEGTRRYWAAERNGMVIGAVTAISDAGTWRLDDLAVLPGYDADAIGQALRAAAGTELGLPAP